jgi:hypothetical protein
MSVKSLARLRRHILIIAVCVLVPVAIASAAPRHPYPRAAQRAFNSSCVKAAMSGGHVNRKKATAYCSDALVCIENHDTLAQFEKNPASKAIQNCEKQALNKDIL